MEGHDIDKLFAEMRRYAKDDTVLDSELWKEWRQDGPPDYIDTSSNCVCGVNIKWEYTMKNIHTGKTIGPIGCVCILHVLSDSYACCRCNTPFNKVGHPAMHKRMKEEDWICWDCKLKITRRFKFKKELAELEQNYHDDSISGVPFRNKTEQFIEWALSVDKPRGQLVTFRRYAKAKQKLQNSIVEQIIIPINTFGVTEPGSLEKIAQMYKTLFTI